MLQQLRGRNLAHVGCTLGLTAGLVIGLLGAIAVITLVSKAVAAGTVINIATAVWIGATIVLGVFGYWAGGYISRRLWGKKPSGSEE